SAKATPSFRRFVRAFFGSQRRTEFIPLNCLSTQVVAAPSAAALFRPAASSAFVGQDLESGIRCPRGRGCGGSSKLLACYEHFYTHRGFILCRFVLTLL